MEHLPNPLIRLLRMGSRVFLCAGVSLCAAAGPAAATDLMAVLPARTSKQLDPIAVGFAHWVARGLESAGATLVPGQQSRISLASLRAARDGAPVSTRDLLGFAADAGAKHAVLVDLHAGRGRIDVLLRIHLVEGGRLVGAGRAAGPLSALPGSAMTALERARVVLQMTVPAANSTPPLETGRLSSQGRALAKLDQGELATAWTLLEGDDSKTAGAIRAAIDQAAGHESLPRLERVRLMATRDDPEQSWKEILREASKQLYAADADPLMLETAGEVQRLRGKLPEAQAYFERALELTPNSVDSVLGLGQTLASQQNVEGARQAYARAHALAPGSPRPAQLLAAMSEQEDVDRAKALIQAGDEAARHLELQTALQHYQQAGALDASFEPQAQRHSGDVLLTFALHTEAEEHYRSAIEMGEAMTALHLGLARALRGQGDVAGAEEAYRAALELDGHDVTVLLELGALCRATERTAEARQLIEQAALLSPERAEIERELAATLHQLGEPLPAMALLELAEQHAGPDAAALDLLATLQREQGRDAEAEKSLERAVGLEPSSVVLRRRLAAVYEQQGQAEESRRQAELIELLGGREALRAAKNARPEAPRTAKAPADPPGDQPASSQTAWRWRTAQSIGTIAALVFLAFLIRFARARGRVRREQRARLEASSKPEECQLEIIVHHAGKPLNGAGVAVRGTERSIARTCDGSVVLSLPMGVHTLAVGAHDRAVEHIVEVTCVEPLSVELDLGEESDLVFKGCPAAVAPFLIGDREAVAAALAEAGRVRDMQRMNAGLDRSGSRFERPVGEVDDAQELSRAAELMSRMTGNRTAPSRPEAPIDHQSVAEAHHAAGDLAAAASAYEAAEDYDSAIQCYRELGRPADVLALLEKRSMHHEAGMLALELNDAERAIRSLRQLDESHSAYAESCRLLGTLHADRGESEMALAKLDEALRLSGVEAFPTRLLQRHAALLEEAGRLEEAVALLESVRRADLLAQDVDVRIEALNRRIAMGRDATADARVETRPNAPPADTRSDGLVGGDRYEILEPLGASESSTVYRALDRQRGTSVALKRMPPRLVEQKAMVATFERDARAATGLHHPNIAAIHDVGRDDDGYFVTMELLDGMPLDTVVAKRGALPPLVVAQLGVQVATGLHFAHRKKLIHGGITTPGLFLTRDKLVKIMGFGLAATETALLRESEGLAGVAGLLAPEQLDGRVMDQRTDLYALGSTLFELSTGQLPFGPGDEGDRSPQEPAPDPRTLNATIPAPLAELILQLLEHDPAERVQKAADVVRVLQGMLDAEASSRSQR
jgi:tetratricopeptide (TPR) repeat protein